MSASRILVPLLAFAVVFAWSAPSDARGGRGGGGGAARASASGSVNRGNVNRGGDANRNTNTNRNTNVDRSTTINSSREVNVEVDNDRWNDWDDHPVAAAAVVTTGVAMTAAAIGSIVYSVPPECVNTEVGGTTYMQCGSTWYAPQYSGSNVQYVVVAPP